MFQIGDSLREARTRRGFTPADVHKAIRIRERYLTALEEERWDMLPGEAYTKGFLRTYAEYLGLNGQLYIDEYNARIARHDEEGPQFVPHPQVEGGRGVGRGVLVALAAVLVVGAAVAGLAAWRLGGSSTSPPPAGRGSGTGSVAASAPSQPKPAAHHPATTPQTTAATGPVFTSISAVDGRCWLLVRSGGPNGAVLFEGVLEQGQSKRFRLQPRIWVRMGVPNALRITLAGKPVTGLPSTPSNLLLTPAGAESA
jgi:cytoskeletal protein RodZ